MTFELANYNPYKGAFYLFENTEFSKNTLNQLNRAFPDTVWTIFSLQKYTLLVEKNAQHQFAHSHASEVHIIGIAINVRSASDSSSAICKQLSQELLRSEERFYAYLAYLSGSFICIKRRFNRVSVVLDATGTIPACYYKNTDSSVVSSHESLIANVEKAELSSIAINWSNHSSLNAGGAYMPGLLSEYDNIFMIPPNSSYILDSGRLERFYPVNHTEISLCDAVYIVIPWLTSQIAEIAQRFNVWVSLSGGLDTRCTLSLARQYVDKLHFFTYYTKEGTLAEDRKIASLLKEKFFLDQYEFPISGNVPADLKESFKIHETILRKIDHTYRMSQYLPTGCLHLRSNILEIARGFYLKNSINLPNKFDPLKLSKLFRMATAYEFAPFFVDFINQSSPPPPLPPGFHYTDLFYWEHRMACYYGKIYRGARPFFDTYSIYNCRAILDVLLSVNLDLRRTNQTVFEIINLCWPDLFEVPIHSGSKHLAAFLFID